MTIPLYDAKARLSEYVTLAEEGEVIVITKHGKNSVLLISEESLKGWIQKVNAASSSLKAWRTKYADYLDDEFSAMFDESRKEAWPSSPAPFSPECEGGV